MTPNKIVVFLADGFEEVEALTTVDILRRAGQEVVTAAIDSTHGLTVMGAHRIPVVADCAMETLSVSEILMTVFPGGMPGSINLAQHAPTLSLVRDVLAQGGFAAAICAAPIALSAAGVLNGKKYTCYPSCEEKIDGVYTGERVTVDGKIITACGPSASAEFAFELLVQLGLKEKAQAIKQGMLFK